MDRLIHEWIEIRPFHSLASFKRLRELSMAVKFEPKRQPLKNIHEIRRGVALLPSKSMNALELWIYLSLKRAILCKHFFAPKDVIIIILITDFLWTIQSFKRKSFRDNCSYSIYYVENQTHCHRGLLRLNVEIEKEKRYTRNSVKRKICPWVTSPSRGK